MSAQLSASILRMLILAHDNLTELTPPMVRICCIIFDEDYYLYMQLRQELNLHQYDNVPF